MSLAIFKEKATGYITLAFTDEDEDAVTPDSATYTLHNEDTEAIINSREDTAVPSLASSVDLELVPDDNVIVDTTKRYETHVLTVKWIYNTDKQGKNDYKFDVKNLTKVT